MAGIVLAICLACSTKDINTKSMHIGTPSCATSTGHTMFTAFQCCMLRDLHWREGLQIVLVEDCISRVLDIHVAVVSKASLKLHSFLRCMGKIAPDGFEAFINTWSWLP